MIRELFLEDMSLWGCVWQSASFALIGLIGSFLLRRRPARASQALFLAMIAAVFVPTASVLVRHFDLGVFVARPVALAPQAPRETTAIHHEVSVAAPAIYVENEVRMENAELPAIVVDSARASIPWRLIALYGWMAASLILLGRLLVAVVSGVYLLRRAQPTGCEQIERAAESARSRLAMTKGLRVRSSGNIHSPVIWCWSRPPALLVPSDLDHKIDWVGVICHELAHWRRKDHIAGLIAELVVCILPWNPLLWWSKKRMVKFSEQACDDWVVATGQPREDYAQSLLKFRPQKQVAFVPAVVSCKKTLAGRVRRILKDSCDNPRTGAAWALTVSAIAICLAAGIAFAQTRPSRLAATIKTKVGQSAVIEQPAFATITIRGRVLGSNNKPAVARIIALPDTSFGAQTTIKDKEGHFELPWSPTWIDEGQPVYLIARSGHSGSDRDEAAIVEVSDPTQPVTIRLEPARLSLEGKVVDPNGQRLAKYRARLSLLTEFKCRAPFFDTTVRFPREQIFSPIPYGAKYRLTIEAEGYQTEQVTVDATDRSREFADIGTITLQPQSPAKPAVAEHDLNSNLQKEFHDIYRLEDGEVIKFIKPPFVLGRQEYLHSQPYAGPFTLQQGPSWQAGFRWDDKLKVFSGSGPSPMSLKSILRFILGIPYHDFDLPPGLRMRMPHGDWIVRHELPMAEQLTALGDILGAELGRSIRFEKRAVERDVIIAKGRYEFKSHPNGNYPDRVHLTFDGALDRGSGGMKSLARLLSHLELETEVEVVNETEPMENISIRYKMGDIRQINSDPELRGERLRALADNLAKTTSLQFKIERRPAEMWFVTEADQDHLKTTSRSLLESPAAERAQARVIRTSLSAEPRVTTVGAVSNATVKTKVGESAAIERLASETIMIKGRILDPNNEPAYGANIVALPVTSWGYRTERRERNKEGYFELPWSPTWIEQDQPIYLMAIVQDPKSQAALVEVTDPTSPVTVRLEPAFAITGKVVDPDGQQIEECLATISLSTEFKCRAPIYCVRGGRWWEHTLSPLPYGKKYELVVHAEGYQTRHVIVDGTDRSQKLINLGAIVLQPKGRAKPVAAEQLADPDLQREFNEVYSLDKDEIIKLIKPPFVLGRQEYFQDPTFRHAGVFESLDSQGAIQACLLWDGKISGKTGLWAYTHTHRRPKLREIVPMMLRMQDIDFNLPKELNIDMPHGDWIVRADSPRDEQLRALGDIIYAETNRAIRFEKRTLEREVIVAKGRYEFKSHPSGISPDLIHVTWDGSLGCSIHEETVDSLTPLFLKLERDLKMKVVDEMEPMENTTIRYKVSKNLAWIGDFEDVKKKSLEALLDNLAKTTSLQVEVERRPVDVWFVTETKQN